MIQTSKTNLPSPGWISSIILKPISGGVNNGILSFHITFTGETPSDPFGATADVILKILSSGYKVKNVTLQGSFPSDDFMLTFVKSLRDRPGFNVGVVIDGSAWYYWLGVTLKKEERLVNWITLDLHRVDYPGFSVDEVIYHLTSISDPEPILPSNTRLFYLSPGELPEGEVVKFLKSSKTLWAIHSPAERKYEVKVL